MLLSPRLTWLSSAFMKVKTLEEALEFVQSVGICNLFSGKVSETPSLWDAVDLPEKGGGRTKWGAKIEAIWAWKNELPETYPDEVYYGKIPGGHAALMTIDYLIQVHYVKAHKPVEACSVLAQEIFEMIKVSSGTTGALRKEAMARFGCTKSRFDTALKQLQVTLNVARSNDPGITNDTWITFNDAYLHLLGDGD